ARTHLNNPELLAGFDDGLADLFALFVRSEHFQTGSARHAVTKRTDVASADLDDIHVEELDVGNRTAIQLRDELRGVGSLNLKAIGLAVNSLSFGIARRAIVLFDLDVVSAGRRMEFNPGCRRRAADIDELVL